jgi:hypothetical protein
MRCPVLVDKWKEKNRDRRERELGRSDRPPNWFFASNSPSNWYLTLVRERLVFCVVLDSFHRFVGNGGEQVKQPNSFFYGGATSFLFVYIWWSNLMWMVFLWLWMRVWRRVCKDCMRVKHTYCKVSLINYKLPRVKPYIWHVSVKLSLSVWFYRTITKTTITKMPFGF